MNEGVNSNLRGGSNAHDFQPQTQNPQNLPNQSLQMSAGLQMPGGMDVLNSTSGQIAVESNGSPRVLGKQTSPAAGAINYWPLVIVVVLGAAAAVVAATIRKSSSDRQL